MDKPNSLRIEKRKIKLLWLIDSLGHGGAENLMPKILAKIDTAEFDQRVCVLQVKDNNPIARELKGIGVPVDFVPIPRLRNLTNLPRLLSYLRRVKPDIVHTQLEFSGTLGCFATKLLGIPNVTTFHTFHAPKDEGRSHWRYELMWASFRYFADLILAVSESVRSNIIEVGRLPAGKVITMHNGIEINGFSKESVSKAVVKRSDFDIPEDAKVILTVAVLRKPKGIQFVLEALPQILQEAPDTYYLIIGDGKYRHTLEELARSSKIAERVRFAGFRTDIPALLALGDIFILPTLDDALPTVLMEAMAARKPLIASNVGGVPEILQDGINGILVPPGDPQAIGEACVELLTDRELIEAYTAAGFEIVQKNFNIDTQVAKLEQTYQELIANAA